MQSNDRKPSSASCRSSRSCSAFVSPGPGDRPCGSRERSGYAVRRRAVTPRQSVRPSDRCEKSHGEVRMLPCHGIGLEEVQRAAGRAEAHPGAFCFHSSSPLPAWIFRNLFQSLAPSGGLARSQRRFAASISPARRFACRSPGASLSVPIATMHAVPAERKIHRTGA